MKHLVTILTIILFSNMAQAQKNNDSFETLWKQVQKLENEALTKSALKVVTTISNKAKKEKNSAQIVKALLYSSKYAMTLEEDSQLKIITDFNCSNFFQIRSYRINTQLVTTNCVHNCLVVVYCFFLIRSR